MAAQGSGLLACEPRVDEREREKLKPRRMADMQWPVTLAEGIEHSDVHCLR